MNIVEFKTDTHNNTFLEFPSTHDKTLKDNCFLNKKILIRKSYLTIQLEIEKKENNSDNDNERIVILLGNPGTGKTFFGLYLCCYLRFNKKCFIYKPQCAIDDNLFIYFDGKEFRIFDINTEDTTNLTPNVWYITDTILPLNTMPMSFEKIVYITSSKNLQENKKLIRHNVYLKQYLSKKIYMPVWNKNELTSVIENNMSTSDENQRNSILKKTLTLYGIVGGIIFLFKS